jgi:hypothetical protein
MDHDMHDYAGQTPTSEFEATATAIRSYQNSIDLYTTDAIDASEDYGYVSPCVETDREMDIEVAPAAFVRIRSKASLKMAISASAVHEPSVHRCRILWPYHRTCVPLSNHLSLSRT